jgi:hypothetical protein
MTTKRHPAVTVHHHPDHGLTHVIPTNGGHDYWVRHADGAFGLVHDDGTHGVTWGYLIGAGELEVIEAPGHDPVLLDALEQERDAEGLSDVEVLEILGDRRAS